MSAGLLLAEHSEEYILMNTNIILNKFVHVDYMKIYIKYKLLVQQDNVIKILLEDLGKQRYHTEYCLGGLGLSMRDVKAWQKWLGRDALESVTNKCRILPRCYNVFHETYIMGVSQ